MLGAAGRRLPPRARLGAVARLAVGAGAILLTPFF
jgi:hypothetical protein